MELKAFKKVFDILDFKGEKDISRMAKRRPPNTIDIGVVKYIKDKD